MKAYFRGPQKKDPSPMSVLLLLERGCLVTYYKGTYRFDWGLETHERLRKIIPKIREGKAGTGYVPVTVDDELAERTIKLGEEYRTKLQGSPERVTIHKFPGLMEKEPPERFQESACRLYRFIFPDASSE
jgi:hypothetical protein